MSMIVNNMGPGSIGAIFVNGEERWKNVKYERNCKIIVGKSIVIDGEVLFEAKKGDKFYCTTIRSGEINL